jgi:molecular chaperone GrpE
MKENLLQRVFGAFRKESPGPAAEGTGPAEEKILVLESRIAGLQMDLGKRDRQIQNMKQDYARLAEDMEGTAKRAAAERLETLFNAMAPPLGQFYAMRNFVDSGRPLDTNELFKPIDILLEKLEDFSFKRIGVTQGSAPYNPALHQAMDGRPCREGEEVAVRVIGFAFEDKIIRKALVALKEV